MQLQHLFPPGSEGSGKPTKQGVGRSEPHVQVAPDWGKKPGQNAVTTGPKGTVDFLKTLRGEAKFASQASPTPPQGTTVQGNTDGGHDNESPGAGGKPGPHDDAVLPEGPLPVTDRDPAVAVAGAQPPHSPEGQLPPQQTPDPVVDLRQGHPAPPFDPVAPIGQAPAAASPDRPQTDPVATRARSETRQMHPPDNVSLDPLGDTEQTGQGAARPAAPVAPQTGSTNTIPTETPADQAGRHQPVAAQAGDAAPMSRPWHTGTIATAIQRRLAEMDAPGAALDPVINDPAPVNGLTMTSPGLSSPNLAQSEDWSRPSASIKGQDVMPQLTEARRLVSTAVPQTHGAANGASLVNPARSAEQARAVATATLTDRSASKLPAPRTETPAALTITKPHAQAPAPQEGAAMSGAATPGVPQPIATDRAPPPPGAPPIALPGTQGSIPPMSQKLPKRHNGPALMTPIAEHQGKGQTRSEPPPSFPMAQVFSGPPVVPRPSGATFATETSVPPILATAIAADAPPQAAPVDQAARTAPTQPASPLDQALVRQMVYVIERTRDGAIRVELDPPELGSVTLRVQGAGDTLSVVLLGERGETVDLLRRNLEPLTQELQKLGYGSVDIELGGRQKRPAPPPALDNDPQASPDPASEPALPVARPGLTPQTGMDLRL